jgi:hypothetical protein
MTNEQALIEILTKIVNRATRATKLGSTEILTQQVPAALIDQARELLVKLTQE